MVPLCEPLCKSRDLDLEAYHKSRFWKLCFEGRGYGDYLAVPVTRSNASFGSWGVLALEERGNYGDKELQLARIVSPHIRRAVLISGALGHERVHAGTLRSALNQLVNAVLIVKPDGMIHFSNQEAVRELERGSLFRASNRRLVGVTPSAMTFVARLGARGAEKYRAGEDELAGARGTVFHVSWAELDRANEELGAPILLILRQPDPELVTPLSAVTAKHRLTPAEAQVLAQVLSGQTLAEVAEILGVARSTVKTHLDSIYRKTGTRRQTELVRLALDLASPLRR